MGRFLTSRSFEGGGKQLDAGLPGRGMIRVSAFCRHALQLYFCCLPQFVSCVLLGGLLEDNLHVFRSFGLCPCPPVVVPSPNRYGQTPSVPHYHDPVRLQGEAAYQALLSVSNESLSDLRKAEAQLWLDKCVRLFVLFFCFTLVVPLCCSRLLAFCQPLPDAPLVCYRVPKFRPCHGRQSRKVDRRMPFGLPLQGAHLSFARPFGTDWSIY